MFRKKQPPTEAAVADQMRQVGPGLDALLASGEDLEPARRIQAHVARALTRLVDQDLAGALEDADAATALGELTTDQERAAAIVEAQAVSTLGLAGRREAALARLEALPTDGVAPERLDFARIERLRLLTALGRQDEIRALVREEPLEVPPGPRYAERVLGRGRLLLDAGDAEGALADVDTALAAGLGAESARPAANTGAYAIAVLGRRDRLDEALAWANLVCSPGLDGAEPGVAERDTRAAVLAVAGRGAEALADLEAGHAMVERLAPGGVAVGWSHAFLARAHLDAGHVDRARHHVEQAQALGARTPVLDAVCDRLR